MKKQHLLLVEMEGVADPSVGCATTVVRLDTRQLIAGSRLVGLLDKDHALATGGTAASPALDAET